MGNSVTLTFIRCEQRALSKQKTHIWKILGMKIIDLFDGTKGKMSWKNKQKQSWRPMFKARSLVFSL